MTVNLVIGTQWGDEGKGKVVDFFSNNAEYVVRFQGGNNAGHTIKVGDEIYKLHIIPSGVIQGKIGVIGNGCVLDPIVLLKEIDDLKKRNITPNLLISDRVNIIMPYHKILDGADEKILGNNKIGTTKRGIGPCYSDKIARKGIRAIDLINEESLKSNLEMIIPLKQKILKAYGINEILDLKIIFETYRDIGKKLNKFIKPTHVELSNSIKSGKNILLEGAQGSLLDVDFGTYPFTTSSHVIAGGASIGTGIGLKNINEIIGIMKAYTTRVGEGPMPTELFDSNGSYLQKNGHEFGTTTSRPRRCGWLDLVIVKQSCIISSITKIAVTKLDVLNGLKKIKICTEYILNGKKINFLPANVDDVKKCKPIYKEFEGWNKIDNNCKEFSDLPKNAKIYLEFIEEKLNTHIGIVSIGPGRKETIEI
jgi:adenylosuccinate synthase